MKHLQNEKGMTLVIVLLTITVFSVLGLSVVGASVSNMKQVSKVESDIKTTDIAEMGIQYYQTQLDEFLQSELNDNTKHQKILTDLYDGNKTQNKLISDFIDTFVVQLKANYTNNNLIFTKTGNFLPQRDVDSYSYFKIKIDPNGIIKTTCATPATNKHCFSVQYESYGYSTDSLPKQLKATYYFSFTIDPNSFSFKDGTPPPVNIHDNLLALIPKENLKPCTDQQLTGGKKKNVTITAKCTTNLTSTQIPDISKISDSFLVFNNGVSLPHLPHGISNSKIFVYGVAEIGKLNPNDALTNTDIVIKGTAKIFDKIMKPKNPNIYVIGNADLTGYENKNGETVKICVTDEVTPVSMRNYPGVYSLKYNKNLFTEKCMVSSTSVGSKSIVFNSDIMNEEMNGKPEVEYK